MGSLCIGNKQDLNNDKLDNYKQSKNPPSSNIQQNSTVTDLNLLNKSTKEDQLQQQIQSSNDNRDRADSATHNKSSDLGNNSTSNNTNKVNNVLSDENISINNKTPDSKNQVQKLTENDQTKETEQQLDSILLKLSEAEQKIITQQLRIEDIDQVLLCCKVILENNHLKEHQYLMQQYFKNKCEQLKELKCNLDLVNSNLRTPNINSKVLSNQVMRVFNSDISLQQQQQLRLQQNGQIPDFADISRSTMKIPSKNSIQIRKHDQRKKIDWELEKEQPGYQSKANKLYKDYIDNQATLKKIFTQEIDQQNQPRIDQYYTTLNNIEVQNQFQFAQSQIELDESQFRRPNDGNNVFYGKVINNPILDMEQQQPSSNTNQTSLNNNNNNDTNSEPENKDN